jgi:hypothetical protein
MKFFSILLASIIAFSTPALANETPGKGEIKEVCKEVEKNGKTVKECRKIKVRKKLDGTEIPTNKK